MQNAGFSRFNAKSSDLVITWRWWRATGDPWQIDVRKIGQLFAFPHAGVGVPKQVLYATYRRQLHGFGDAAPFAVQTARDDGIFLHRIADLITGHGTDIP